MTEKLILPSHEYKESYNNYINELGDEERYPFPLDFDHHNFTALLMRLDEFSQGINIPEGFVPSSTYWLIKNHEIIGVSNLRHYLNDRIQYCGGHIGLGIRPSYRGRGFGNTLMALTIHEAHKKGIKEIHIHCHKSNQTSARMIISQGGVLVSELEGDESTDTIQRYVVKHKL